MENFHIEEALKDMVTNLGTSVFDLSYQHPILLVFLRRFGCTFCREAMDTLSQKRKNFESLGTRMVLVHMGDNEAAEENWDTYNLKGVWNVSDPNAEHYKKFGLVRGNFRQLFGLTMWMDGVKRGAFQKYGVGAIVGDGFQMPGTFMVHNGEVRESFIHKSVSDQPDYRKMLDCCVV